ncbi:MAG TPA: hypothetical protein VLJ42_00245 [Solirubrobacteraceae bacterium]|nr:hypothetical protein [Solirubrobacteraceae bacterium]
MRPSTRFSVALVLASATVLGLGAALVRADAAQAVTIITYDPGPTIPTPATRPPAHHTHAPAHHTHAPAQHSQAPATRPPAHPHPSAASRPAAPSAAKLGQSADTGSAAAAGDVDVDTSNADASASAPPSTGDPLVSNGLGSPLCRNARRSYALSSTARSNCRTSGFVAAEAPTGNYGLDVHINTGTLGLGNMVATAVQDMMITPTWMALVWVVHTLIVAVEWAYTIDLLDGPAMVGVARGLREAQEAFTQPWLVLMLIVTALFAAYNGLLRRRVAQTLGEVALVLAMMTLGLWVIADPFGTIGALERWSNQASIGTLGAVAHGAPNDGPRTLADSMQEVFEATVDAPWCFMEFGDVNWCRDPVRMDPRIHSAALWIAANEPARASLLRRASTNGELFRALPTNQWERNAIDNEHSLLRVMCQNEHDDKCGGETARQAEFRTPLGTWPRAGGLLLIVSGSFGMIALLGFIATRLLGATIMSLFYLLLAPAVVLAPALGDGGRAVFRTWGVRLLEAVSTKLIYSFLLGVVLLLMRIMLNLQALGWWTQWLMISVLWWSCFRHRKQLFSSVAGVAQGPQRTATERVGSVLRTSRELSHAGRWVKRRRAEREMKRSEAVKGDVSKAFQENVRQKRTAGAQGQEQVARMLDNELRHARETIAAHAPARESTKHRQLERVRAAERDAHASGDQRRALRLQARGARIEQELAAEGAQRQRAKQTLSDADRAQRAGRSHTTRALKRRAGFLDAQTALPAAGERIPHGVRRDYPALAALAGYGLDEYRKLDAPAQRKARLQIDRELALRKELNSVQQSQFEYHPDAPKQHAWQSRHGEAGDLQRGGSTVQRGGAAARRTRAGAPRTSARTGTRAPADGEPAGQPRESAVMRDARAVAEGRKRQLGFDRE